MTSKKTESKLPSVTLLAPDGSDYEATNPTEVNQLVYGGYGYKPKNTDTTLDAQIAGLAETLNPASAPAATDTTTA